MNVNEKTQKLFKITDITEDQAQALMNIACRACEKAPNNADPVELETLNNLRQAFLSAGIQKSDNKNAD